METPENSGIGGKAPKQKKPRWYYAVGDSHRGPIRSAGFVDLLKHGTATASTLVWKKGMQSWTPLSEVPKLRAILEWVTAQKDSEAGRRNGNGVYVEQKEAVPVSDEQSLAASAAPASVPAAAAEPPTGRETAGESVLEPAPGPVVAAADPSPLVVETMTEEETRRWLSEELSAVPEEAGEGEEGEGEPSSPLLWEAVSPNNEASSRRRQQEPVRVTVRRETCVLGPARLRKTSRAVRLLDPHSSGWSSAHKYMGVDVASRAKQVRDQTKQEAKKKDLSLITVTPLQDEAAHKQQLQLWAAPWTGTDCMTASSKFVAVCARTGKEVAVVPLEPFRLTPSRAYLANAAAPVIQTGRWVYDLAFDPFDAELLATGGSVIKLWRLPSAGLSEDVSAPLAVLTPAGHSQDSPETDSSLRICTLSFNPIARGILAASTSADALEIWDLDKAACRFRVGGHRDMIYSCAWGRRGSCVATTCKDGLLRLLDPRVPASVLQCQAHESSRPSRLVWLGQDSHALCSVGFTRTGARELSLWDQRKLARPVHTNVVDGAQFGMPMLFYCEALSAVILTGKGESSVSFFDVQHSAARLDFLAEYKCTSAHRGMCSGVGLPVLYRMSPEEGLDALRLRRSNIIAYALGGGEAKVAPSGSVYAAPREQEKERAATAMAAEDWCSQLSPREEQEAAQEAEAEGAAREKQASPEPSPRQQEQAQQQEQKHESSQLSVLLSQLVATLRQDKQAIVEAKAKPELLSALSLFLSEAGALGNNAATAPGAGSTSSSSGGSRSNEQFALDPMIAKLQARIDHLEKTRYLEQQRLEAALSDMAKRYKELEDKNRRLRSKKVSAKEREAAEEDKHDKHEHAQPPPPMVTAELPGPDGLALDPELCGVEEENELRCQRLPLGGLSFAQLHQMVYMASVWDAL